MHPERIGAALSGGGGRRGNRTQSALARAIWQPTHSSSHSQATSGFGGVTRAGAAPIARARADMARLAAAHRPRRHGRSCSVCTCRPPKPLPRAARTEAPLQAAIRRQSRRRSSAGARWTPTRAWPRRGRRAAEQPRVQRRRPALSPQRLPRVARTGHGDTDTLREARGRRRTRGHDGERRARPARPVRTTSAGQSTLPLASRPSPAAAQSTSQATSATVWRLLGTSWRSPDGIPLG